MSIFKDAGDSLMKYGEMIVNKTEEYSKIAKLNVEIKKIEWDMDRLYKDLGKKIMAKLENNETSIDGNESEIQELHKKYIELKEAKAKKREEIEEIKAAKDDIHEPSKEESSDSNTDNTNV